MPSVAASPTETHRGARDPAWGPAARWAVPVAVDWICHSLYHVEVQGRQHFTHSPATIVAMTHRRDADALLATGPLLERRGLRFRGRVPYFVGREDLLRPRFLREYLVGLPWTLRRALGALPLPPILWACRVRPMRRVPERTLRHVLEDVLLARGNLPLEMVLRDRALRRFSERSEADPAALRVRDALHERFRPLLGERYGLMRLRPAFFHELKPFERAAIREQLWGFTDLLAAGETLVMAPEGMISPDGSPSRIRRALFQLVGAAPPSVRVLPVGITYDFMIPGRTRVFVDFGPELRDLACHSPRLISEITRTALLRRLTVTATQLAGRHLLDAREAGEHEVQFTELTSWVAREASRYHDAGVPTDPRLLAPDPRRRRLERVMRWGVARRVLERAGGGRYRMRGEWDVSDPDWRSGNGAFRYARNELSALTEGYPQLCGAW